MVTTFRLSLVSLPMLRRLAAGGSVAPHSFAVLSVTAGRR
jgi:hypothetical protein